MNVYRVILRSKDIFFVIIALIVIKIGVSTINDEIFNTWMRGEVLRINIDKGIGIAVFRGMILGVALNRISGELRAQNQNKVVHTKKEIEK